MGEQIDILWDSNTLAPEAHCSSTHSFSKTYTPVDGKLDWATAGGQYDTWPVTVGSHSIQANNQATTNLFSTDTIQYTVTG